MAGDASQRQQASDVAGGGDEGFWMREIITLNHTEAPETHTFRGLD